METIKWVQWALEKTQSNRVPVLFLDLENAKNLCMANVYLYQVQVLVWHAKILCVL